MLEAFFSICDRRNLLLALCIWTHVVSVHVAFWQSEELVAFGTRLHDFFEGEVHVGVALDEVAVEGFAVLELDEHGVALRGGEKAER
jgi:hypothetical protein